MDYLVWPTEKIRSRVREAATWSPSCSMCYTSNPHLMLHWYPHEEAGLIPLWTVISTGVGIWPSLNYRGIGTVFYPPYSINTCIMSYELGALESPVTDTASALLAHTEMGRGYEGLKQKPDKVPTSAVQRHICPTSTSCISHSKAGILPLLSRQLILDHFSLRLKSIITIPAFIGLPWGPNEIVQELAVPSAPLPRLTLRPLHLYSMAAFSNEVYLK